MRSLNNLILLVLAAAVAAASPFIASALLRHVGGAAPRIAIALLPVAAFAIFVLAELRWLRATDEFHRRVALESLAIAFPIALALAVACDALQKAGLIHELTIGDVWPYMALLWAPALAVALLRYR